MYFKDLKFYYYFYPSFATFPINFDSIFCALKTSKPVNSTFNLTKGSFLYSQLSIIFHISLISIFCTSSSLSLLFLNDSDNSICLYKIGLYELFR